MLTLDQKQARLNGLGGSDAAAVVGLSPYKSPYQLFLEKRQEAPVSDEESECILWGSVLEEPVAEEWARRTNRKIRRQPMMTSAAHPFMLVNLDRQIIGDVRGPGVLEVKCFGEWSGRGISNLEQLPDHVYLQLQHALAVTEYEWGSVAILVGGQRLVHFDIERNDEVIAELIRQEAEFWERVQTGNPPSIDGSARTGELLKKLYPSDTGKTLVIDAPPLIEAARLLVSAKAVVKNAEADITLYENQLKSAIGDASEAKIEGFGSITWKRAKDSVKQEFDIEKLKVKYPDAFADCQITRQVPGSRRFLLRPNKEKEAA